MSERFDEAAGSYSDRVQDSIAFVGQEHGYFIRRKAEALQSIAERHFDDVTRVECVDVGCGVGEMEGAFTVPFRSTVGVEPSFVSAQRASAQKGLHPVNGDGKALPLADDSADIVFTVNVLHHVEPSDRDAVIAEMVRVARPGGLVVAFEHNPINPLTRASVFRCEFDEGVKLLRSGELRRRFKAAGLESFERRYIIFTPFDVAWQHRVERRIGWLPVGAQHYLAARVAR